MLAGDGRQHLAGDVLAIEHEDHERGRRPLCLEGVNVVVGERQAARAEEEHRRRHHQRRDLIPHVRRHRPDDDGCVGWIRRRRGDGLSNRLQLGGPFDRLEKLRRRVEALHGRLAAVGAA